MDKVPNKPEGLDWVRLRTEMLESTNLPESSWDKFTRRLEENPFVPIGAALTVGCLTMGLINLKRGNIKKQQNMMRLRVIAQGCTILIAIGGIVYSLPKSQRNISGLLEHGEKIKKREID